MLFAFSSLSELQECPCLSFSVCLFLSLKYLKPDTVIRWDSTPIRAGAFLPAEEHQSFPALALQSSLGPRFFLKRLGSSLISAEFCSLQDLTSSVVEEISNNYVLILENIVTVGEIKKLKMR